MSIDDGGPSRLGNTNHRPDGQISSVSTEPFRQAEGYRDTDAVTHRHRDCIAAESARADDRGGRVRGRRIDRGGVARSARSAYFLGGTVIYTRLSRTVLLGISDASMRGLRPSTEPYAALLARTTRERFGADWAIAETGAAGPSGNRYGDNAGHSCSAIDGGNGVAQSITIDTGSTDRQANMRAFARVALELLRRQLSL